MKIELKKIEFSERMSQETNCFVADIYCDGKKVGYCSNDGHGGCTTYHGVDKFRSEDITKMEEYCKTLPPEKSEFFPEGLPMDLEMFIDLLLEKYLIEKNKTKFNKKMEKDMLKGLIVETSNGYQLYTCGKLPIEAILMSKENKEFLKKIILKLKGEGKTILNTNLPKEIYDGKL